MSQDKTFPEPEAAVQSELAELVQRALAEQKDGTELLERLQKMTERLPKWTPLPESPDDDDETAGSA